MSQSTATDRLHPSGLARLRWWAYYQLLRAALGAAFFAGAWITARWIGLWLTLPIVACAAAVICGFVAMELSRAAGRVSYINRVAVIVLAAGLRISRGRLLPMFAWSTGLWSIVGFAGAICGGTRSLGIHLASTHATVLGVLLIASLFVDGATFILLVLQAVRVLTPGSPVIKTFALMLAGILALMIGSVALWMANLPLAAILLAGGPPLIVGGFYGLFFIVLILNPPR